VKLSSRTGGEHEEADYPRRNENKSPYPLFASLATPHPPGPACDHRHGDHGAGFGSLLHAFPSGRGRRPGREPQPTIRK
jgi:hypothetical protein